MFGGEKDVIENVVEWVQTGHSDCEIDGEALAKNISKAVSELNSEGYRVVQVTSVISGRYDWGKEAGVHQEFGVEGVYGMGYGYGYSYTEVVTIIAEKIS